MYYIQKYSKKNYNSRQKFPICQLINENLKTFIINFNNFLFVLFVTTYYHD